jgi:RimJ/RimL family protein N-acetyltransferase
VSDLEGRTRRLLLRQWRDDDLAPFVAMNADPRVMEFFPEVHTPAESAEALGAIRKRFAERGFGIWAVGLVNGPPFIGMVGLSVPRFEAPFTPCVEVLWRLASDQGGRGCATEAARAALTFGFERIGLSEIVAFTTVGNLRSRRVMEKLGMTHTVTDDFLHPALPEGHHLRPHVLYRIKNPSGPVEEGPHVPV